ncbi:hypothetical protein V5799_028953 [Amblyomma americanum]|uniref:Secreted protein n=1 Tax=Amblyomma americanum TaxID=6943 RepID=A0AAQ4DBE0_AMBAM
MPPQLRRFGGTLPLVLLPLALALVLVLSWRSGAEAHLMPTPWPPFGMPDRPLRWGYLAYGSSFVPCGEWLARLYMRRDKLRDYPYCAYGSRGLYNLRPKPSVHDRIYGRHKGPATDNDD